MEFRKILVPVVGSEADADSMRLACRLGKRDKGKIWSVYAITIKRALPLDTEVESETKRAEDVLERIEKIAKDEGCEVETDILQAREAGPAIVNEATERGIDLILMGVKYKRRFGQFSLGDVAPYVMKNAPCPVILYQQ